MPGCNGIRDSNSQPLGQQAETLHFRTTVNWIMRIDTSVRRSPNLNQPGKKLFSQEEQNLSFLASSCGTIRQFEWSSNHQRKSLF